MAVADTISLDTPFGMVSKLCDLMQSYFLRNLVSRFSIEEKKGPWEPGCLKHCLFASSPIPLDEKIQPFRA